MSGIVTRVLDFGKSRQAPTGRRLPSVQLSEAVKRWMRMQASSSSSSDVA